MQKQKQHSSVHASTADPLMAMSMQGAKHMQPCTESWIILRRWPDIKLSRDLCELSCSVLLRSCSPQSINLMHLMNSISSIAPVSIYISPHFDASAGSLPCLSM